MNTVAAFVAPKHRSDLFPPRHGDALLGGGTWLFSEPQPDVERLIDLGRLGWTPVEHSETGLSIAATCTIADLNAFAAKADWPTAPLFGQCARSLLGSFKIWNAATVGGNICLALPAGPMTSLTVSLNATGLIWTPDGGERRLAIADLVAGPRKTALALGEVLRQIDIPAASLQLRTAFRRISLTALGRSAALLIGSRAQDSDAFVLTVTAATPRPIQLRFSSIPQAAELQRHIDLAIPDGAWFDDIHGRPDWRQHVARLFAEEIRLELAKDPA